ncbi:MAG TPA: formylmethanofuran dehydrogenase subunit B [Candidatus Lokiarchaeia archaeon]
MIRINCSGCSLLCDDILVNTNGSIIDQVIGACKKGKQRLDQLNAKNRITSPMIRKNKELKKVSWEEALNKVKEIIKNSSKPILYGFSTSSCEAQLKGIELAKKINGFIDSNSIICQGKVLNVAKDSGITLTTLAEIINKADLLILWGANIADSIPRLLNKALFSRGKFRLTGREIKTIIMIDPIKTASFEVMQMRDTALYIQLGKDIDLIRFLKENISNVREIIENKIAGLDKEDIKRLIINLMNAEYGVIFVGQGLLKSNPEYNILKELIELVRAINSKNEKGRLSLVFLGGHYNMVGFEHVALSFYGKNHSLQFSDNLLVNTNDTIVNKVANDDFDCSVIVGTDPISNFPSFLSSKLASKPLILIDNKKSATMEVADVFLPSSLTGLECEGLAYRFDHVPIQLKKILNPPSDVLSDEEILNNIIKEINKK